MKNRGPHLHRIMIFLYDLIIAPGTGRFVPTSPFGEAREAAAAPSGPAREIGEDEEVVRYHGWTRMREDGGPPFPPAFSIVPTAQRFAVANLRPRRQGTLALFALDTSSLGRWT